MARHTAALITAVAFWGLLCATGSPSTALLGCVALCLGGFVVPSLRLVSVVGLQVTLGWCIYVASPGAAAPLVPAFLIVATRHFLGHESDHRSWLLLAPLAATLGLGSSDRDLTALAIVSLAAVCPVPASSEEKREASPRLVLFLGLGLVGLGALLIQPPPPSGKVALVEMGTWARTDVPVSSIGQANMQSLYSYSELKRLLGAHVVQPLELSAAYGEAWIVTPTRPASDAEVRALHAWVARGGHLIVVTDHTDLFGHGRTANQILQPFGLKASLSAFFADASLAADVDGGKPVHLKTSNCLSGAFLWPRTSARWTEEKADYSEANFFGSLQPTQDDRFERKVIAGTKAVGRGFATVLGDSTILANFAIYQPGTIAYIEALRAPPPSARALLVLTCCSLLGLLLAMHRTELLVSLPLLGLLFLRGPSPVPTTTYEASCWAGDADLVCEWTSPDRSLSTAYALLPWLGVRPRWVNRPTPADRPGIWVSATPPPLPGWTWLSPESSGAAPEATLGAWHELTSRVNADHPAQLVCSDPSRGPIKVGGLWTNSAVGDWWVSTHLSKAKQARLLSLAGLLRGTAQPAQPAQGSVPAPLRGPRVTARLSVQGDEGVKVEHLQVPDFSSLPVGAEVNLGAGVSAEVVRIGGAPALVGGRELTEGWHASRSWVLIIDGARSTHAQATPALPLQPSPHAPRGQVGP